MSRNTHSFGPTIPALLAAVGLASALALACDRGEEGCQPAPGRICTYLGSGEPGLGDDEVAREDAQLYLPQDLTFAADDRAYVLDWNNHRIIAVDAEGTARQVVGTGELGDAPDGRALEVNLNHPTHLSNSPTGTLIISAWHNSKIIEFDPNAGTLKTICGNGMRSFGGDGGPAKDAILDLPVATAFDAEGNMYITDQANQRIRRVDTSKNISTFVGTGMPGYSGDGGPADGAEIKLPGGQAAPPAGRLAIDRSGTIYLADSGNHRIRKIDPNGVITTYAGNGDPTYAGDGGPAISASLSRPSDLELDADGNLYIADTDNSCVRKVDKAGTITTVAGQCGNPGYGGDGGRAADALLDRPYGVAIGPDKALYIADTHNHRIRVVYLE